MFLLSILQQRIYQTQELIPHRFVGTGDDIAAMVDRVDLFAFQIGHESPRIFDDDICRREIPRAGMFLEKRDVVAVCPLGDHAHRVGDGAPDRGEFFDFFLFKKSVKAPHDGVFPLWLEVHHRHLGVLAQREREHPYVGLCAALGLKKLVGKRVVNDPQDHLVVLNKRKVDRRGVLMGDKRPSPINGINRPVRFSGVDSITVFLSHHLDIKTVFEALCHVVLHLLIDVADGGLVRFKLVTKGVGLSSLADDPPRLFDDLFGDDQVNISHVLSLFFK